MLDRTKQDVAKRKLSEEVELTLQGKFRKYVCYCNVNDLIQAIILLYQPWTKLA